MLFTGRPMEKPVKTDGGRNLSSQNELASISKFLGTEVKHPGNLDFS
jgi:hypothetical protein